MPTRGVNVPYQIAVMSEESDLRFPNQKGSYLVECCGAFVLEDLGSTIQSAGVSGGRLKANFDDI